VQEKVSESLGYVKADLICSDAVPDFVGERFVDHMKSVHLNLQVVNFCEKNLKKGGTLLMKIIQGPAEQKLFNEAKLHFEKLQRVKPSASRQESKEIYLLGQGYE
jgi:23S rRNA (uridine2552-2'-O)-methyltransferase